MKTYQESLIWLQLHWKILVRLNTTYLDLLTYCIVIAFGIILSIDGEDFFHIIETDSHHNAVHKLVDKVVSYVPIVEKFQELRSNSVAIFSLSSLCIISSLSAIICTLFFYNCKVCLFSAKTMVGICLLTLFSLKAVFFHDSITPVILLLVWVFSFISLLKT